MTIYVTKFALSRGIQKYIQVPETSIKDDLIAIKRKNASTLYLAGEGRHWHKNFYSAFTTANKMKEARIKFLEKQLERMKTLKF